MREFVEERKQMLGMKPTDKVKQKVPSFYNMCFRARRLISRSSLESLDWPAIGMAGASGEHLLQVLSIDRNWIYGRSWLMAHKISGQMMWFNESDLESEADDEMKQKILRIVRRIGQRIT